MSRLFFLPPGGGWPIAGDRVIPTPKRQRGYVIIEMLEPAPMESEWVTALEDLRRQIYRAMIGVVDFPSERSVLGPGGLLRSRRPGPLSNRWNS